MTKQRFSVALTSLAVATPEQLSQDWFRLWETEFAPKLIAEFRAMPLIAEIIELISDEPSTHAKMGERIANLLKRIEIKLE